MKQPKPVAGSLKRVKPNHNVDLDELGHSGHLLRILASKAYSGLLDLLRAAPPDVRQIVFSALYKDVKQGDHIAQSPTGAPGYSDAPSPSRDSSDSIHMNGAGLDNDFSGRSWKVRIGRPSSAPLFVVVDTNSGQYTLHKGYEETAAKIGVAVPSLKSAIGTGKGTYVRTSYQPVRVFRISASGDQALDEQLAARLAQPDGPSVYAALE